MDWKRTIAEGEAILQRTHEAIGVRDYGPGPGPYMRRWLRGEIGRGDLPSPRPAAFEPVELNSNDRVHIQAAITMEKLAASTKRPGLAKAAKRAVGVYLLKLRENRDKTAFLAVLGLCGIGKNRAYQLMAGARKASNIKGKTAAGTGLS
jgi:hypothetical protein